MSSSFDRLIEGVSSSTPPPHDDDIERRGSVDSDEVATRLDPALVPDALPPWSLMPGSQFRRIWDYVLIVSVFYSITVVPFQFAFLPPYPVPIDNVVVDTIFILDVVVQSISFHSNTSGDVILPRSRSFVYYLKGWFLVDVVSSIPYSYIALTAHLTVSNGAIFVPINMLRLTRFFKVLKAVRLSNKYTTAAFSTRLHPGVERLLRLLFLVFLVGHLSACLWYFIGRVYDDNPQSWINRYEATFGLADTDALDLYVLCLYFAFTTLATVGYGDITPRTRPEVVFTMMLFIIGVAVFSYAMANVTSLLYEIDRDARFFRNRMGALLSFCRTANVGTQVQQQVLKQMSREWRRAPLSEDWESIRNDLPTDVRSMLMWHIYSATFRASRTFTLIEAQSGVVHRKLVGSVRPFRAVRGQVIAKEGDACKGIYLTSSGSVEQIVNRVMVGLYSQGYSFGEIPMFLQKNMCWTCTFRCRTSALFLYISKADLLAALADSDQIQDVFTQRARSKLQRLREACGLKFPRGNDLLQNSTPEVDLTMVLANMRSELDKVQEMASASPFVTRQLRRSSSDHILRRQLSI